MDRTYAGKGRDLKFGKVVEAEDPGSVGIGRAIFKVEDAFRAVGGCEVIIKLREGSRFVEASEV